jgi:AraC-like DNA-binding protein
MQINAKTMKVEFSAKDNPREWIEALAAKFGTSLKNDAFELPSSLGKGYFKQIYFFEGLTLTYCHFKLFKYLELIRYPVPEAQLIPIMFYGQDTSWEQNIDGQKKLIGYHTSNGIFMPSPQIQSRWMLQPNIDGFHITLTFEKNWFLKTLGYTETVYINRLLKSCAPFYLFEPLTSSMKQVINTIHRLINSEDKLQSLKLHQKSMELLNLFLEKVEQRTIMRDASNLNTSDIETVFKVRKQLLENLPHTPSLKQLASDAGMSISKLQKCFQQVFGKSISQYALSEKMNLAKQLLGTKKYSVSEVGYQIGYSNLSHFTKAFNKEFGINPKAYQQS